ncbi:MAG: PAS domain S-box protein [Brevinematales bacterium]|nr:PAS domain S-box protein [Brevinematales bacterium]
MSMKINKFQVVIFIFMTGLSIGSYFHLFRFMESPDEFFFFLSYLHVGLLYLTLIFFLINDPFIFKVRQRIILSIGIASFVGNILFTWLYFRLQMEYYFQNTPIVLDSSTINSVFRHHLTFSEPFVLLFFIFLVIFILFNFQQIKNLKRLDELNRLNRKLYNFTGIPLLTIGDGKIISFNNEAVNQFGYSAGEFKKLNPEILFYDTLTYQNHFHLLGHSESVSFETDCLVKDGSLFRASVNLSRFTERGKTFQILVIKNISDIIRNLQATKLLNMIFNLLLGADPWQDAFPEINKLLEEYFSSNSFYIYLLTYEGFFKLGTLNADEDRKTRKFYIKSDLPFFIEESGDNLYILSRIFTPKNQYGFILFNIPRIIYNEIAESTIKNISTIIAEVIEADTLFKELDNSEKTYRTLVDHSLTGIYLMQENRIFIANAKFFEITGYTGEDIENGIDSSFLIHPDSIVEVETNLANQGTIQENRGVFYTFKG